MVLMMLRIALYFKTFTQKLYITVWVQFSRILYWLAVTHALTLNQPCRHVWRPLLLISVFLLNLSDYWHILLDNGIISHPCLICHTRNSTDLVSIVCVNRQRYTFFSGGNWCCHFGNIVIVQMGLMEYSCPAFHKEVCRFFFLLPTHKTLHSCII